MTVTPDEAEIILDAIDDRLLDVHTALPGVVASYDKDKQTAEIDLGVHRMVQGADGKYVAEPLPRLPSVRVGFLSAGGFFVSLPVEKGNPVLVIFSEASIDQFRTKGTPTKPGDGRRHTLTGGIALPIDITLAGTIPNCSGTDLVAGKVGGQQVRIKPGGTVEVTDALSGNADDYVAQSGKVQSELQTVKDAIQNAAVLAGDGGATFKTNILAGLTGFPGSVASGNLKADD